MAIIRRGLGGIIRGETIALPVYVTQVAREEYSGNPGALVHFSAPIGNPAGCAVLFFGPLGQPLEVDAVPAWGENWYHVVFFDPVPDGSTWSTNAHCPITFVGGGALVAGSGLVL